MEQNLLSEWCRLWMASLVAAGVESVVICPGSRSTPLVVAAEEQPGLRRFLNIDERSAAFFALGQAKMSGRPSAVICTSGTAGAHFYPAIIEALHTRTPLLLLTADRPPELQGNAAPQTIDQTQLFGNKVRGYFDLGLPDASVGALRGLRRKAVQAVASTLYPIAGAVHVNIPARKPLEPVAAVTDAEKALRAAVERLCQVAVPRHYFGQVRLREEALDAVAEGARAARRPVLTLGPMKPCEAPSQDVLQRFVERTGWPVCAELTSQARSGSVAVCDAFEAVLGAESAKELRPDCVLHLGAPLTASPWAQVLGEAGCRLFAVSQDDWVDPDNRAELMLHGDIADFLERVGTRLEPADPGWSAAFQQANQTARAATDAALRQLSAEPMNEALAVQVFGAELRAGDALVLGNSLPVRLADSVIAAVPGVAVISQRGANGIDGLISMAGGVAAVHSGRVFLLLGDISALHDLSGIGAVQRAGVALTVAVLNNGGGRIFDTLPVAGRQSLDAWTTPHTVSLRQAGELFGVPSYGVCTPTELQQALTASRKSSGPVWIECVVDPSGAPQALRVIRQQVERALSLASGAPRS